MPTKIFIHGLESSNQGTKATYFREKFPDMLLPNFPGSLEDRMKKLEGLLLGEPEIILVGSSFGGLMAALFALSHETRVKRMILLAPAINMHDFSSSTSLSAPVVLYHGRQDEVIPLAEVEPVAGNLFRNLNFHAVEDDHFLHRTFKAIDWPSLLT